MNYILNDDEQIWLEYCDWILDEAVGIKESTKGNYGDLFVYLHNKPFEYYIPKDKNRAIDGLSLRKDFMSDKVDRPCSVLEMLAAFSIRIDSEYTGDPKDPCPGYIFEMLLNNLKLLEFENSNFNAEKVNKIVDIWLSRNFTKNGIGSIFPLKGMPHTDQREIQIWDQLMFYLSENNI